MISITTDLNHGSIKPTHSAKLNLKQINKKFVLIDMKKCDWLELTEMDDETRGAGPENLKRHCSPQLMLLSK